MSNKHYEVGDLLAEISIRENPSYYLVIDAPLQEVSEDDGEYKLLSLDNEEISYTTTQSLTEKHLISSSITIHCLESKQTAFTNTGLLVI